MLTLLIEEILHKLIGSSSVCPAIYRVIHPRYCRMSSINNIIFRYNVTSCNHQFDPFFCDPKALRSPRYRKWRTETAFTEKRGVSPHVKVSGSRNRSQEKERIDMHRPWLTIRPSKHAFSRMAPGCFFWFLVFQNLRNTTKACFPETHTTAWFATCLGRHLTTLWMLPQLFKVTFQPTHRKLQQVAFLFYLSWSLRSSVSGLGQRVSRGPKKSSDTPESSADVLNSNLRSRKPAHLQFSSAGHSQPRKRIFFREKWRPWFFGAEKWRQKPDRFDTQIWYFQAACCSDLQGWHSRLCACPAGYD